MLKAALENPVVQVDNDTHADPFHVNCSYTRSFPMIEVSFKFNSVDDAKAFLAGLGKKAVGALSTTEVGTGQPPAPPVADVAPQTGVGAGAAAATPLPGVNVPTSVIPPAPSPAPASSSAPAPDAAAPQAPAAPDQAALIAAFTALGQAKGRDALAAVLAEFGAKTVVGAGTGIPQDKWAAAIERCKQVVAS